MPRTSSLSTARLQQRRQQLAQEAARLMAESGFHDPQQALRKAVQRLGIDDDASQPRSSDIDAALRSHQRLFNGAQQPSLVQQRRQAALQALHFFVSFAPRLHGAVLDGTATARSPVQLHLHSDDPDAVQRFLHEHGIPADLRSAHIRLDVKRSQSVSQWLFEADAVPFELTVLPADALRQAPLASLGDKPLARASAAQLQQLLAITATAQPLLYD